MRVLIVGAGAQAKYALETFGLTGEHLPVGLVDLSPTRGLVGQMVGGAPVLGGLEVLGQLEALQVEAALVCCPLPDQKAELSRRVLEHRLPLVRAVHPSAVIASTATICEGTIVNALAVIQPYALIGRGAMIHAGVIVEHDSVVEDYTNLAPGVALAGHVHVGRGARVFTGASVGPNVRIGEMATVGAGAVVLRDVPPGETVVGVPARRIERTGEG